MLTAGWLHAGVLHILFNVLWIRQLGPAVADLYGPGRMVILYTWPASSASPSRRWLADTSAGCRSSAAHGFSVGASAPIFGLLGALVYYGRRTGSRHIGQAGLQYALFMGIFGLIMPGIDNQAHLGGFVGGYLGGLLLDPLKPERMDHLMAAAACLVVTLAAVVWSVVTALPLLMR